MSIPTDRGYAIITVDEAGKTTVSISASLPVRGRSEHIFAVHVGEPTVAVHKEVPLTRTGKVAWSTSPVQVYVDPAGLVHVAPLARASAPA